eukprot:205493-Lingulodinium_polyedra.AAC.1
MCGTHPPLAPPGTRRPLRTPGSTARPRACRATPRTGSTPQPSSSTPSVPKRSLLPILGHSTASAHLADGPVHRGRLFAAPSRPIARWCSPNRSRRTIANHHSC